MKLYLVGGAVREHLLGRAPKDFDFAVEAPDYETMYQELRARGLRVWQERPEFVTVRGNLSLLNLGSFGGLVGGTTVRSRDQSVDADFTLCREETMYSDKRHPDKVTPADLMADLRRRDFTVNAVAVSEAGEWVDPFDGVMDAKNKMLRTVGSPLDRFDEDPLRMLRAVRFAVTCGLSMEQRLLVALDQPSMVAGLLGLPHERVREELNKALRYDWWAVMAYLMTRCPRLGVALYNGFPDLWFEATTAAR